MLKIEIRKHPVVNYYKICEEYVAQFHGFGTLPLISSLYDFIKKYIMHTHSDIIDVEIHLGKEDFVHLYFESPEAELLWVLRNGK